MGGRSRIFLAAAVVLLALNLGLAYAVVQQRDQATLSRDQAILELQLSQLQERLDVAKAVDSKLPEFKTTLSQLQSSFRAIESRLYNPEDQSVIEGNLTRMATSPRGRGPGMGVDRISTRVTGETPPIRKHTFSVHLRGKMTLLPAFSEEFYNDPMLANVSRFAAMSPDMRFRDMDMVVRAHYYEADLDENPGPSEKEILEPFDTTITATGSADTDPRLSALRTQVAEARGAIQALHPKLIEAASLDAKIAQYKIAMDQYETLVAKRGTYKDLATENLPKLYLRVRNSPLGGAALNISGDKVTFPDYAGDE